mgnify:CR=1 FL=1
MVGVQVSVSPITTCSPMFRVDHTLCSRKMPTSSSSGSHRQCRCVSRWSYSRMMLMCVSLQSSICNVPPAGGPKMSAVFVGNTTAIQSRTLPNFHTLNCADVPTNSLHAHARPVRGHVPAQSLPSLVHRRGEHMLGAVAASSSFTRGASWPDIRSPTCFICRAWTRWSSPRRRATCSVRCAPASPR